MKKAFKSVMSVFLSFIILISVSVTAFAKAKTEPERSCPVINIHGFMAGDIYTDKTDETSETVWPLSTVSILKTVGECLPAISDFADTHNWQQLESALTPSLTKLFSPSHLDENGDVNNNSGRYFEYPDEEDIKQNSLLSFNYDWRKDPFIIADELNEYIDYILNVTGCQQVSLNCHSLGGIIALTYVNVYGEGKINAVCLNTTAINGLTYEGELFSGNLAVTADSLKAYLEYMLGGTEYDKLMAEINKLIVKSGLVDFVAEYSELFIEHLSVMIMQKTVIPMFCSWPTIWAMIPDSYIDACMDYVFNTVYSGLDKSGLIDKITHYNNEVRSDKNEVLQHLNLTKNLIVISRYGYSSVPFTDSWSNLGDGTLDTKLSSFGATTAVYGQTLSDSYLSNKNQKFISPDKTVDASTCLFPEQTWFVKNLKHSEGSGWLDDMILELLYASSQPTVNSYEKYPQFLIYEPITTDLLADTAEEMNYFEKASFKLQRYFIKMKRMIEEMFDKIIFWD